jgi:hypothetical protein
MVDLKDGRMSNSWSWPPPDDAAIEAVRGSSPLFAPARSLGFPPPRRNKTRQLHFTYLHNPSILSWNCLARKFWQ